MTSNNQPITLEEARRRLQEALEAFERQQKEQPPQTPQDIAASEEARRIFQEQLEHPERLVEQIQRAQLPPGELLPGDKEKLLAAQLEEAKAKLGGTGVPKEMVATAEPITQEERQQLFQRTLQEELSRIRQEAELPGIRIGDITTVETDEVARAVALRERVGRAFEKAIQAAGGQLVLSPGFAQQFQETRENIVANLLQVTSTQAAIEASGGLVEFLAKGGSAELAAEVYRPEDVEAAQRFLKNTVRLDTGEFVDRAQFEALPLEEQEILRREGTAAVRDRIEARFSESPKPPGAPEVPVSLPFPPSVTPQLPDGERERRSILRDTLIERFGDAEGRIDIVRALLAGVSVKDLADIGLPGEPINQALSFIESLSPQDVELVRAQGTDALRELLAERQKLLEDIRRDAPGPTPNSIDVLKALDAGYSIQELASVGISGEILNTAITNREAIEAFQQILDELERYKTDKGYLLTQAIRDGYPLDRLRAVFGDPQVDDALVNTLSVSREVLEQRAQELAQRLAVAPISDRRPFIIGLGYEDPERLRQRDISLVLKIPEEIERTQRDLQALEQKLKNDPAFQAALRMALDPEDVLGFALNPALNEATRKAALRLIQPYQDRIFEMQSRLDLLGGVLAGQYPLNGYARYAADRDLRTLINIIQRSHEAAFWASLPFMAASVGSLAVRAATVGTQAARKAAIGLLSKQAGRLTAKEADAYIRALQAQRNPKWLLPEGLPQQERVALQQKLQVHLNEASRAMKEGRPLSADQIEAVRRSSDDALQQAIAAVGGVSAVTGGLLASTAAPARVPTISPANVVVPTIELDVIPSPIHVPEPFIKPFEQPLPFAIPGESPAPKETPAPTTKPEPTPTLFPSEVPLPLRPEQPAQRTEIEPVPFLPMPEEPLPAQKPEPMVFPFPFREPVTQPEIKPIIEPAPFTEPMIEPSPFAEPLVEPEIMPDTQPISQPIPRTIPPRPGPKKLPKITPTSMPTTQPRPFRQPFVEPMTELSPFVEPMTEPSPFTKPLVETEPRPLIKIREAQIIEAPPRAKLKKGKPRVMPKPRAFRLPDGSTLPPGVFPKVVQFNQGVVSVAVDLTTGAVIRRKAQPPYSPSKSFKVLSQSSVPPKSFKKDVGAFLLEVSAKGLRYSIDPANKPKVRKIKDYKRPRIRGASIKKRGL